MLSKTGLVYLYIHTKVSVPNPKTMAHVSRDDTGEEASVQPEIVHEEDKYNPGIEHWT